MLKDSEISMCCSFCRFADWLPNRCRPVFYKSSPNSAQHITNSTLSPALLAILKSPLFTLLSRKILTWHVSPSVLFRLCRFSPLWRKVLCSSRFLSDTYSVDRITTLSSHHSKMPSHRLSNVEDAPSTSKRSRTNRRTRNGPKKQGSYEASHTDTTSLAAKRYTSRLILHDEPHLAYCFKTESDNKLTRPYEFIHLTNLNWPSTSTALQSSPNRLRLLSIPLEIQERKVSYLLISGTVVEVDSTGWLHL